MASRRLKTRPRVEGERVRKLHDLRIQYDPALDTRALGVVTVDDPKDALADVIVFRNLRDDPLVAMHNASQIDQAQYIAGRHWQKCYELSEMGGARAIDPTKEAVDGGRFPEPLSDAKCRALGDLAKAMKVLGLEGGAIISDVLGRHMTLAMAADSRGLTTQRERDYIGMRFRECLDTLAVAFGYAMNR